MIKIYKDIVFWTIVVIWAISNTMSFCLGGDEALMCSNMVFILMFCLLILCMVKIRKFNDWLHKEIKK